MAGGWADLPSRQGVEAETSDLLEDITFEETRGWVCL
jgi:hypothetical protein